MNRRNFNGTYEPSALAVEINTLPQGNVSRSRKVVFNSFQLVPRNNVPNYLQLVEPFKVRFVAEIFVTTPPLPVCSGIELHNEIVQVGQVCGFSYETNENTIQINIFDGNTVPFPCNEYFHIRADGYVDWQ